MEGAIWIYHELREWMFHLFVPLFVALFPIWFRSRRKKKSPVRASGKSPGVDP